jgi:two-component system chemotaxis sensor kinase CheA
MHRASEDGEGIATFVIPAFAVRESLRPKPEQIHSVYGQACMVQVRDRLIPSLHLGDLFGIAGSQHDVTNATVVVLEDNGRPTALIVDELIGKQEVVIKSLGRAFEGVRGVAGGAILGDGRVGLILDAGGLAGLMGKDAAHQAA